jgi:hypothetical protein
VLIWGFFFFKKEKSFNPLLLLNLYLGNARVLTENSYVFHQITGQNIMLNNTTFQSILQKMVYLPITPSSFLNGSSQRRCYVHRLAQSNTVTTICFLLTIWTERLRRGDPHVFCHVAGTAGFATGHGHVVGVACRVLDGGYIISASTVNISELAPCRQVSNVDTLENIFFSI